MTSLATIAVDQAVKSNFPGHGIGLWRIHILDLNAIVQRAAFLQEEYAQSASAKATVELAVDRWKSVFARMGAKSGERSSIDTLNRSFLRLSGFRDLGPFINFYNALSLMTATPLGAYAASSICGQLSLGSGLTSLSFTPMGKPEKSETTRIHEVYYHDAERVICRLWNHGDCDETKIDSSTKDIVLCADLTGNIETQRGTLARVSGQLEGLCSVSSHWSGCW